MQEMTLKNSGWRDNVNSQNRRRMVEHSEKRTMPYSAQQMYNLVADIERYSEFLPWCAASRVRSRSVLTGADTGKEQVDADLVISFKIYREKFGSRVILNPQQHRIDVAYLQGPFKYLNNYWYFKPLSETSCEVDFHVDFEFKSRTLQMLIGIVFNEAMQLIVRAFEKRAKDLYGSAHQLHPKS
jgi:coenzyme Q-binding protein COQ10